jgi:putative transposase
VIPIPSKTDAQAIYLAPSRRQAEAALHAFRRRWQREYPTMVRQLDRDLPELLAFFAFPKHLWRKLRTTNIIERCFVEVRRRTRSMVCFVRDSTWNGNPTVRVFTQAA